MNTKKHTISVDQIQNLEIDRNGRVMPRLNDLDPLENTLLSVLYPGIKVASVNVPVEPLDEYVESKVENALANLVWRGTHYKLVGASGSAKKGKFYFVDQEHSRPIAERFQHWPQAAIVYFGILVSPCKVMMEESDARVLVVPDHSLGTNDCRGWIRRSVFGRLQQAGRQNGEEKPAPQGHAASLEEARGLIGEIEAMAEPLDKRLYRGLLKSAARVWNPTDIRDVDVLRKVLRQMQSAERGLRRLEAALDRVGPETLVPILRSLRLNALAQVDNLDDLKKIVLAVERAPEIGR
jgi:hypothetical protein